MTLLFLLACPSNKITPVDSNTTLKQDSLPGDSSTEIGVCGDGRTNGPHESCDADDDAACPGACSAHCACPALTATGELSVHMIDVWQGDGLLVISPDGFAMMVDAGDWDQADAVKNYLSSQGVTALNYTVASHMHSDHIGSLDDVLHYHPEISVAFDNGGSYDSGSYDSYVREAGDRRHTLQTGDTIDLGPSMEVDVLHAGQNDMDNENNNSIVLRLRYNNINVLLGGDCESEYCESTFDPGPIDIYKVHHHGSSDSSSTRLLDEMQPRTALISVGQGNDYGHPTSSTLSHLEDVGARVWRTDLEGDVVVRSDGQSWTVNGQSP